MVGDSRLGGPSEGMVLADGGEAIHVAGQGYAPVPASRRRRRFLGAWLLIPLALVGFVAWRFGPLDLFRNDPFDRPESIDLPPVEQHDATRAYLGGSEGARVLRLAHSLRFVIDGGDATQEQCRMAMEEAIPDIGSPKEVVTAIAGIPDPDTADMANGVLETARRWLPRCSGGDFSGTEEIRFRLIVLDRRLKEIGP